jgi:uncharacterized protein (DUF58 family)
MVKITTKSGTFYTARMISKDILAQVRKLEIRTKGLVNNLFGGEYHSAFKGRGMIFSEVRPYQYGDDIRQIDWNVTARTGDPHIKIFEEEREQTLMLLVDISPSGYFGSGLRRKIDLITELCAVLAFSAIKNNDKVGLVLFTDRIEKVVLPRKGRTHVLRLIRDLYATVPVGSGTNLSEALTFTNKVLNRRSIVILTSDFIADGYEQAIRVTHRKHDLVNIHIVDSMEYDLPNLGMLPLRDAETGHISHVPTFLRSVRNQYRNAHIQRLEAIDQRFRQLQLDRIRILSTESYIEPLRNYFIKRSQRY